MWLSSTKRKVGESSIGISGFFLRDLEDEDFIICVRVVEAGWVEVEANGANGPLVVGIVVPRVGSSDSSGIGGLGKGNSALFSTAACGVGDSRAFRALRLSADMRLLSKTSPPCGLNINESKV